jgi:hypothetical protein
MASLLWRSGFFVACGLLASPALFLGCREILSFEEREFDPSLADGGADADAADPLSCDAYCARIQEKCTAAPQYPSLDACLGVCLTFPVGSLDDTTGHTLGCRVHVLEVTTTLETADCAAAGPSGDGACGTKCESYCTAMERICPDVFSGVADCIHPPPARRTIRRSSAVSTTSRWPPRACPRTRTPRRRRRRASTVRTRRAPRSASLQVTGCARPPDRRSALR